MTVAVVTDSAATLPDDLASRWGVTVVPLQVIIDGVAGRERVDVSDGQVLDALVEGREVSTSQPSVAAFTEAFARLAADGATGIVAVLLSGGLSGTVDGARVAAAQAEVPVEVVDSRQAALGTGFAALAAAALARGGGSLADTAAEATRVAASARCVFTVDTLDFLHRGGRLSSAAAAVGRMLQVRPVLEIVDGRVEVVERVRSTARARAAVAQRSRDAATGVSVLGCAVLTLGDASYGDAIAEEFAEASFLVRAEVSAVLAVHAGPGALAIVTADLPAALA